jgi:hypothetical protein
VGSYTQTAGATILNGGTINGGPLNINGGALSGTGTINANVSNGGQVIPGGAGAAGTLTINGNYTQTATGSLKIEIGGTTPGTQYDQLNVNGPASLGGTLNLSILPNIGDVCGGTFAIVNASPLNGTFGTINGLSQPGGLTLTPAYGAGSLTITASRFTPTTTITASVDPSLLNQPVTFTVTVAPPAGANDSPTGTVQFQVDGVNFGAPVSLTAGQASFNTSTLAAGSHTITALYRGDTCFYAGAGNLTQSVQYVFGGFQAPLNQSLTYALNRAIPVRFNLSDFNNTAIASLGAVTSLQIASVTSGGGLGTPFTPASTGNTGLHLEGTTFAFNWQTKGLAAGTYRILLALNDGTVKTKDITLSASGAGAGLLADGSATTSATGTGALQGGDVALYVDNSSGLLTADELARINDAVAAVDTVLAPYGVTVSEVNDSGLANVVLDTQTTSAVGGYADGVLGCETAGAAATEITIIQGWNWYAGSDSSAVGSGQYDFETVVMHELGHALGLGHSADSTSVMYATLSAGTARRVMTTADLNVPDADTGACGLHAAGLGRSSPTVAILVAPSSASAVASGTVALMPLDNSAARDTVLTGWSSSPHRATMRARVRAGSVRGPEAGATGTTVSDALGRRRLALQAVLVDAVIDRAPGLHSI